MIEFWVKLIEVTNLENKKAREKLEANCTHVNNDLWLFEGDEEYLQGDGLCFDVLDEQALEGTGGMNKKQLIKLCLETYVFDESLIKEWR